MHFIKSFFVLFIAIYFSSCSKNYEAQGLQKVSSFGSNKGNLNMYYHQPENEMANMPLVIVLHGCTQSAKSVAESTDWNQLSDEYGFYLLYPEQKSINNISSCFNWFLKADNEKNKGEAASIKSMTDYMIDEFGINSSKIYVTGLSAGAAMTMVMLSTYPEMYAGGAALAGVPYKSGLNTVTTDSPEELGDNVRSQNVSFNSEYPKLMILQGEKDKVVNPNNAQKIEEQWLNVIYGTDLQNNSIQLSDYNAEIHITDNLKAGEVVVKKVIFDELAHAIPIDKGDGETQGGQSGTYTKDVDFFSSYWIADFFGLLD